MERFKKAGLKLTPQRIAIFKYLDGNESHPSAEQIFSEIKKTFPTMSFATVYNTIETLKDRGELLELTIDPRRRRYDPHTTRHHHIMCIKCKKIADIHSDSNVSVPAELQESFEVLDNHITFYGKCANGACNPS